MIPGLNKRALNFYDLMLYVALVRKHLRLMVLLVCMCMLMGLVVYIYSRPVFYAHAMVQVDSLGRPLDTDTVYHDGNLANVVAELKGPDVLERTAARLGVTAQHTDIETKFLRTLKIYPNAAGNLEVEIWSYERTWPARWTEVMVEEFMKLRQEQREKYRDTVMKTYGQELTQLNAKIDSDQESKFTYEDEAKFTQASIDVARLKELPTELAQIKQRMDQLESIRKRLDNPEMDTVSRLSLIASADTESPVQIGQTVTSVNPSAALGITGSAATTEATAPGVDSVAADSVVVPGLVAETLEWQNLEKKQRELLKEEADLSRTYLAGNQKMLAVHRQLDQVGQSLKVDYDVARVRFDFICRSLQDRYNELQKKLPEYEEANRKYAKIQQSQQLHEAGQLGWSTLYGDAAKTISELEYTADKEKVNLRYDQMVELREDQVSPNKLKVALLSLLMGLAMAFAVPFLIEYLDYTLSNLEEVEATFQMRGLGIIPQMSYESDRPVLLDVGAEGDERNLVENFRVVRTNLLAMGTLSKPPHVIMITSAMPKEGKTVVSSNLAISFGQTGVRTLLVDTDLRRGRLHRLFGLRKSPGLSDYLLEKVPLEEAIRPSGKENLSILSAGQHVESGTELLGSTRFTDLMTDLRSKYERIIVDTPPVLGLSETSVLQNQVDGVLFVIWSGRTPIGNMKTAIDILSANGANFYGFILNRLDLSATTNYYQYYYYSSDYYHSYHALENA
jgi:capsular exopolysaccharide synthesis family protein